MSELYNILLQLCEDRGISGYRMCKDVGIQPSVMTDLKMGRRSSVKMETAQKIADYFGVSVGYLSGVETEKAPAETGERKSTHKLRSIARLQDSSITPEQDNEIANFIDFCLSKDRK